MADINAPVSWAVLDDDLEMVPGRASLMRWTTGREAVAQNIESVLKLARGEWAFNLLEGLPWHEEISGAKYNEQRLHAVFREALLRVDNVSEIVDLTLEFDRPTRELTVRWQVDTDFGIVEGLGTV